MPGVGRVTPDVVGVGFIGCGDIAHHHSSALRDLVSDGFPVRPVAAADPVPAHREAVARNLPFERYYDTAEELLADPEVDAVWVGLPTALHRRVYGQVIEAGKHLYAEKPIAPDLASVRELAAMASAAPTTTQVGFQTRFDPLLNRVRDLVGAGEIGPVMSYLWRDDEGFPTTSLAPGRSDWRSDPALSGGGVLIEHSIHALDALQWMFGPIVRVTARVRHVLGFAVEDTAVVLLEHASGVVGTHVGVYGGVMERDLTRVEIQGRDAIVEIERNGAVVDAPDNKVLVQRASAAPVRWDREEVVAEYVRASGLSRPPFFLVDVADRAFVDAVLGGRDAAPGMAEALAAHAVIDAIYRSADEGRPIDVEEP